VADRLGLSIDRASDVALGTQLLWRLRALIATGELSPEARLPGIHELAAAAGVNVNTVRKVLARLEDQGLLRSEQGRGTFVASTARPDTTLAETASAARASARAAGIDPRELAATLYATASDAPAQTPSPDMTGAGDSSARRRELYGQIKRLELQLARLEGLGPAEHPREPGSARVLSLAELLEVRDRTADRINQLQLERAEGGDRERAEQAVEPEPPTAPGRWRDAGIWTGWPTARVSWTAP
jgi:DNA-binding transcriptional regulator YhcF (GntR family)